MLMTLLMIAGGTPVAPPAPKMLATPDGAIHRVLVSPDGKRMAANVYVGDKAKDGSAAGIHCPVWDTKTWAATHTFTPGPPNVRPIAAAAFTPDGKRLLDAYAVADLETKAVTAFDNYLPFPGGLELPSSWLSKDGRRCASRTSETGGGVTLRVSDFDPAAGTATEKLAIKVDKAAAGSYGGPGYALTDDGKTFVYGTKEDQQAGVIKVVDVATGRERLTIPTSSDDSVQRLGLSPDGNTLVTEHYVYGGPHTLKVWDLKTGKPKAEWKAALSGPRFTRDGRYVVGMTKQNKEVTMVDAKTGKPVAVLPAPYERISSYDVAPDGSWVAIAGGKLNDPRQVGVWKTADYKK